MIYRVPWDSFSFLCDTPCQHAKLSNLHSIQSNYIEYAEVPKSSLRQVSIEKRHEHFSDAFCFLTAPNSRQLEILGTLIASRQGKGVICIHYPSNGLHWQVKNYSQDDKRALQRERWACSVWTAAFLGGGDKRSLWLLLCQSEAVIPKNRESSWRRRKIHRSFCRNSQWVTKK